MCQIILDKLFVKFQQFLKMEHLKLSSYLNTLEKYNEMIRATDTVKKYEEVSEEIDKNNAKPNTSIMKEEEEYSESSSSESNSSENDKN